MTDKPSEWAMGVWNRILDATAPRGRTNVAEAAALVIEQARKEWESEVVEWLRGHSGSFKATTVADAIERGEYRKDRG